jgi:tetratricopeptide (TPR) repeat protein
MLHGVILGYMADETGSSELYEDALGLFSDAKEGGGPEALRLYAMTAGRLGRWKDALPAAHDLIQRVAAGEADAKYANTARQIATELFDRIDDVDALEHAVETAKRLDVVDEAILRSHRAFVLALRGDVNGAARVLGVTPPKLAGAAPADQVRVASGYVVKGHMADALAVLSRNEDVLSNPDGLLILARAALAAKNTTTARRAFKRVAEGDDAVAETAALALELVDAIERSQAWDILDAFTADVQGSVAYAFRGDEDPQTAPDSFWEGPPRRTGQPVHPTESPVLNRLTADDAATLVMH